MSDLDDILPFDDDSFDPTAPQKPGQATLGLDFAYIGQALSPPEFTSYVANYAFGTVPPDFVVLHHTAVPTLAQWTANEAGLSDARIRMRRLDKLAGLRNFYANLGWTCGPHLFIDDRYIYVFTPMNQVGIHAKWGNSFRAHGQLHYSIGIEVIGDYSREVWPVTVARNVVSAVRTLQTRLRTFDLHEMYPTPESKPGMLGTGSAQRCAHPTRLRFGGISSHRDYNKIGCPGAAITEDYYMAVLNADAPRPPASIPLQHYRVKKEVTGGATIRAYPRVNAAILGRLHAGDSWDGEPIEADAVTTLAGFGSSRIWVRSIDMRCVWSGLLEKVKP